MAATLTQIANNAGVSLALVSRFYSKDANLRISEEKRQAILDSANKLGGVRVNRAARSLSTRLTHNISVPINQKFGDYATSQLFGDQVSGRRTASAFLSSLADVLRTKDFRLSMNLYDPEGGVTAITDLLDPLGCCDGLVLLTGLADEALAKLLLTKKIPHVCMDATAEVLGVNTVIAHSMNGLRQAASHLCELGHRRIGFFGPRRGGSRFPQFVAALLEKDLPVEDCHHCLIPVLDTIDGVYPLWLDAAGEALGRWLADGGGASALICQNDDLALKAVEVIREHGLEPGREISVIGYDNIERLGGRCPAGPILTSIDNPTEIIGRRCGELLFNQILHRQHDIVHEHIPTKLIVRTTTGPYVE